MKILQLFGRNAKRHIHHGKHNITDILQPSPEARNTTLKIDAIESAMSAEFSASQATQHANNTEFALSQSIEEAAVLFASGQPDAALNLLTSATNTAAAAITTAASTTQEQLAWWMQFDLCQVCEQQSRFEQLAIAYAKRFETSPPQWNGMMPNLNKPDRAETIAALNFSGKLCGSSQPLLERLRKLGEPHASICLEFGIISESDSDGCAQLLHILQDWQSRQTQVMLKGAQGLADKIQSLIQVGRRDDSDAPWLLLIELLRLMNDPAAHEEMCVAYCITFEVSPPAFNPPLNSAQSTPVKDGAYTATPFKLPALIDAPVDSLLQSIAQATSEHSAIALDCTQLACVHFTAAAPLIAGLLKLADGKPVELENTNFLVSVLLRLVGCKNLQISTRKL